MSWQDLPTHHGGMHDIFMWYCVVNAGMHCIDVTMGIDTLISISLVIICCIMKIMRGCKCIMNDSCIIFNMNIS
jgi:hypothetical protein